MEEVTIWTASACQGDPGAGGYAFIIVFRQGSPIRKQNARRRTTRHRMEMFAAIRALTALEEPHNVSLKTTDTQLIHSVVAQDYREAPDLAEHLLPLLEKHNVAVTMNKTYRDSPEYQDTYTRALKASRSNPQKPDTGFEEMEKAPPPQEN